MSQFSEESLGWLDKLETINASVQEDPTLTQTSFVGKLKISPSHASYLYSLKDCLDQAAIAKIRQAASPQPTGISSPSETQQVNPPYTLSFTSAKALIGLKKKKVADLHGAVHAALDVILARHLTTKQIGALVEWMVSGKPAAEFDPKFKLKPAAVETAAPPDAEEDGNEKIVPIKRGLSLSAKPGGLRPITSSF